MAILTPVELKELYTDQGLTDKEIAETYAVDRTWIVHLRKQYGIQSRIQIEGMGLPSVITKLTSLGFRVQNLRRQNMCSNFDLLLDGRIRVEVFSANRTDQHHVFRFTLTDQASRKCIESANRIRLANGRTKKKYEELCDYAIFIGIHGGECYYWVMPSSCIGGTLQTLALTPYSKKSKYRDYQNAWYLLADD